MDKLTKTINEMAWQKIADDMHQKGYAIIPNFLSPTDCDALINQYDHRDGYRKTVVMERYRFGLGEYKYWSYPLPNLVQNLRQEIYPHLAPIANLWMKVLKIENRFPKKFEELQDLCHGNNQLKPTPLILKYGKGGFNTLHQDLYGDVYFPIQAAVCLSQVGRDYTGGEFVLTQQTPRAQSKVIVLTPQLGDMIIFTTNFRPVKGSKGYYRAPMRHGVSEIQEGERYMMGLIFHDAEK